MHILIIEPEAKLDIANAIHFYNQQRAGLGREFLQELTDLLTRVGENPRQYQAYRRHTRKAVMSRFPYLLFYHFDDARAYCDWRSRRSSESTKDRAARERNPLNPRQTSPCELPDRFSPRR
jgi:hypothetical protein